MGGLISYLTNRQMQIGQSSSQNPIEIMAQLATERHPAMRCFAEVRSHIDERAIWTPEKEIEYSIMLCTEH